MIRQLTIALLRRADLLTILLLVVGAVVALKGCVGNVVRVMNEPLPYSEVARVPSRILQFDAVLIRRHAHSTVSDPYELYLVPYGAPVPDREEPLFRADLVCELSVGWSGPSTLRVQSRTARFFLKEDRFQLDGGRAVLIRYESGSEGLRQ